LVELVQHDGTGIVPSTRVSGNIPLTPCLLVDRARFELATNGLKAQIKGFSASQHQYGYLQNQAIARSGLQSLAPVYGLTCQKSVMTHLSKTPQF
jgi:hypothetical protein